MTVASITRHPLGGTDGFRGPATLEAAPGMMNPETVAGLTVALVEYQRSQGVDGPVVVGHDGRPSADYLVPAVIAGANYAGAGVVYLDRSPTPTTLRTARIIGAAGAVSVSASHNEAADNGWKGTLVENKPFGNEVKALDNGYWANLENGLVVPTSGVDAKTRADLVEKYINDVVADIIHEFDDEQPLKDKIFVYDGANGAAINVTPQILERLGARVERFACDPQGVINDGCGATDLEGVKAYLRTRPDLVNDPNFVGAIANDGDADRMMAVGAWIENGEMKFREFEGNRMMELYAQGQEGIVGTVYTNDGIKVHRDDGKTLVRGTNAEFHECGNGDAYVTQMLREKGLDRGGEFTGHHVILSWLSSGDGVRMGAWLAAYAAKNQTTIAELCKQMPLWPQPKIQLDIVPLEVPAFEYSPIAEAVARAHEEAKTAGGRLVLRPSGTETTREKEANRLWAVGNDEVAMFNILDAVAGTVAKHASVIKRKDKRGSSDL